MPTASEQEKDRGNEKKEPRTLITEKTCLTRKNGGRKNIPSIGENTGKGEKIHRHHLILSMQRWTGYLQIFP